MALTWLGGMASKLSWASTGQTVFKFTGLAFHLVHTALSIYSR